MMVDKTGIGSHRSHKPGDQSQSSENSAVSSQDEAEEERMECRDEVRDKTESDINQGRGEDISMVPDKSPGGTRTKSNQRWMKLRTTVQLSGAISNTIQKSKPPLKREDSFLKRFSTRQIPETQETLDTGDETEPSNGIQTQDEVNRRRRKRRKEQSRTVVNPDENFYFYWLMTVTVCVLYNLWTLIVRQSFPELQRQYTKAWYGCDIFTDIVFVCDIVVQFRTGYLEQGLMVYDSKKLAKHYLKSRAFIFDLISLIPLDLLQIEIGTNPILRFPRFLKIYRVYNYYYIVESRTVYPNLWRVVNLIHILLILAHWFGCFYYLLSEAEGFQGAWVYPFRQGDDATLTRKYLGSLYWSTLTLTTIGDLPTPETNAEYIFTIVSYLIGVFIFATIVGQVGNVITNRNANRLEFERLLDGAKTYMRHHKVPGGMKRRVLRWYDYSWSRGRIQGGGDINTALGLLPDKLKTELALHVNLSVLKKVTIFQECQPEFLHDLVLKMKAYIFTPGDLICRKGEIAREMFIIADGILDVISETGRVLTTMKAGDFFGEIGILNLDGLNKRTADVRSVGYSELFSLSREDVLTAMKDYPEAQEILQNLGRKRLMEARNASKIHKAQAKHAREHESSGESDNTGKRIVEKLRSDVKGLKNALRRSRRETQDEEDLDGYRDSYASKNPNKKHSILRRMSHVQSSDEYETNNEGQTPIGVGLPLLQRLKLLKEKQEKEKEDKNKALNAVARKEIVPEPESGVVPAQRLVSVKEKDDSEEISSEDVVVSPPSVGGQEVTCQSDRRARFLSPSDSDVSKMEEEFVSCEGTVATCKQSLLQKLKCGSAEEKDKNSKHAQQCEMPKIIKMINQELSNQETSINVPKANGNIVNSVPKQSLGSKLEVPKNKERWNILRRSTRPGKVEEESSAKRVSSKGAYLSKSDTVLEKQKSDEFGIGKRSRSMSPSDDAKNRRRTLRSTVEYMIRERRRSRSLNYADRKCCKDSAHDNNLKTAPSQSSGNRIKKYNSIDDLSPEYSGLPFVKKLKILNERQKLAELVEKELVVRSASLDVPERGTVGDQSLTRSRSVQSTIDIQSDHRRILGKNCEDKDGRSFLHRSKPFRPEDSFRAAMLDMKQRFAPMGSSGSLQSPESNETMERRHLKSILKKLSAEDTSDEDQFSKGKRRSFSLRKRGPTDLKKLMRAPTVEGYVARHTKLTKSVTFDRETMQSPTDAITVETNLDESAAKGLSPTSPTAILTLQLSNLSMIPIASPKLSERGRGVPELAEEDASPGESGELLAKVQEELKKLFSVDPGPQNPDTLPYESVVRGIGDIVQGHMDTIHGKLRSKLEDFQDELQKRDEVINALRIKIEELESLPFCTGSREPGESTCNEPEVKPKEFCCSILDKYDTVPAGTGLRSIGCSPILVTNLASLPLEEVVADHLSLSDNAFGTTDTDETCPTDWCDYQRRNVFADTENESGNKGSDKPQSTSKPIEYFEESRRRGGAEDVEMTEMSDIYSPKLVRLRRNVSLDSQNEKKTSAKDEPNRKCEARGKGLISKVTEFRRSLSKSNDFVAVEIDSSNSSEPEETHSNDWEVQMLVEELSKKETMDEWTSSKLLQMEEMKKLEDDVNTLKHVVCESNLTRFTASELDMLETILEAKDQRISEIASSSCFDIAGQKGITGKQSAHDRSRSQYKSRTSIRHKIGQALSFDFHDMESRKKRCQRKATTLRKQKSATGMHHERQSLENLLHASSLLRTRVLEDAMKSNESELSSNNSRCSLPLIGSQTLRMPKTSKVRTSLPILSRSRPNEFGASSVSSSDDCQESDLRESYDSVFDENQLEMERLLEFRAQSSTGRSVGKSSDGHNSVNYFIKTMGQKVKHAMVGEGNALREQVPTISMLCEEQAVRYDSGRRDCQEATRGDNLEEDASVKPFISSIDPPDP